MQLIADSGSTKVDWRAIKDDGSIVEISTEGINPVFITPEEIVKILSQKLLPVIGPGVKNVYFYGAGVVSPQLIATLSESFKKVFPESETFAASDVLAAARALCGHNPGIACIMGTGSNSCFYDGENIAKNVRAGGFILGDEASGGVLGKKLISDFIKGLLPAHIQAEFDKRYDLDYMKVVEKVYKQPMPSRFLASFAPFINEFIAVIAAKKGFELAGEIKNMVTDINLYGTASIIQLSLHRQCFQGNFLHARFIYTMNGSRDAKSTRR